MPLHALPLFLTLLFCSRHCLLLPFPCPGLWLSSSLQSQDLPEILGSLRPETQETLGLDLHAYVFGDFPGGGEWGGPLLLHLLSWTP